jgi:ribosomal protein S18 acetylase RimI-like enzyme
MIKYRTFRNNDPPALAEIWRSHPPLRALVQPMTAALLEQYVFAKPYFDALGFFVAVEDDRAIGFAHAGFMPNDDGDELSTDEGVVSLIMVVPHTQRSEIAKRLLRRCEEYLKQKGAHKVYAGGASGVGPFYLGLYGGCLLPGILSSDRTSIEQFEQSGFVACRERAILHRQLTGFRPLVDRQQMQLRRGYNVEAEFDPKSDTWWNACTFGQTDQTCFHVIPRDGSKAVGRVNIWDMEPMSGCWGVQAVGILELEIRQDVRRQGLATFLLGEAIRQLQTQRTNLIEAQVAVSDTAAIGLFRKLGFEEVERGVVFEKKLDRGKKIESDE